MWSGGKDSTASIILAHIFGLPLDLILFSEVMFSKDVSGEHPEHLKFVKEVAIPLFESWGYKVQIVRSDITYLDNFYTMVNSPRSNLDNTGKFRGFPLTNHCVIQRDCKKKPIRDFLMSLNEDYVAYLGICADEKHRLESLHKDAHNQSLLEVYGLKQSDTTALCEEYGLLSPTYSTNKRGGCWFCMWAKDNELRSAMEAYPEAFRTFMNLENDTHSLCGTSWNVHRGTIKEIVSQF